MANASVDQDNMKPSIDEKRKQLRDAEQRVEALEVAVVKLEDQLQRQTAIAAAMPSDAAEDEVEECQTASRMMRQQLRASIATVNKTMQQLQSLERCVAKTTQRPAPLVKSVPSASHAVDDATPKPCDYL